MSGAVDASPYNRGSVVPARLMVLTRGELTRDPRARRTVLAGRSRGLAVDGVCVVRRHESPADLPGVDVVRRRTGGGPGAGLAGARAAVRRPELRELRGLYRLARLLWTTVLLVRSARSVDTPAIVHAHDLDTLPAGFLIARRARARLVYDAHELYSEFEFDPPRLAQALLDALERTLARRADAVVTVSEPIARELETRCRLRARPLVVLNCPEVTRAVSAAPARPEVHAVYQAAVGPGRVLSDLFDAAARAPGVALTLRVVGADVEALEAEARRRDLDGRVVVVAPVPPAELVTSLAGFDAGLVIDRPTTRNNELALPNKLFEYLMAGLAVVVPRLPAMTELVEGLDVGVTFEPGSPDALADALSALAADRDRLTAIKQRARRLALERFNAEAQAAELVTAWGI
jgi:glycosyltransferase involved in cell wall biosynthesis